MDVTEPSTPEEVVSSVLAQPLDEADELDTDVAADNVVIALRQAGFLPDEDPADDLRTAAQAHGIFTGALPHIVCTHPIGTPCPKFEPGPQGPATVRGVDGAKTGA